MDYFRSLQKRSVWQFWNTSNTVRRNFPMQQDNDSNNTANTRKNFSRLKRGRTERLARIQEKKRLKRETSWNSEQLKATALQNSKSITKDEWEQFCEYFCSPKNWCLCSKLFNISRRRLKFWSIVSYTSFDPRPKCLQCTALIKNRSCLSNTYGGNVVISCPEIGSMDCVCGVCDHVKKKFMWKKSHLKNKIMCQGKHETS